MTYTYATLEVSTSAYDEIAAKLREAGYNESFHGNGVDEFDVIDMHGIALTRATKAAPITVRQILDAIDLMGVPELSMLLIALKDKYEV